MNYIKVIFLGLSIFLLSGCATLVAPSYSPSYESIDNLKKMDLGKVSVAQVEPHDPNALANHITLRGSKLNAQEGTFALYLEKAIRSDLIEMGFFDPASSTRLDAVIIKNDIDISGFSKGLGTMEVKLTIHKSGSIVFEKLYSANTQFESSFAGAVAIPKGQSEYPNLVRELLQKIYSDSAFIGAVKK